MAENKDSYKPDLFDPKYLVTLDEIYHSHWAARKKQRMKFLREAVDYFWPKGHPSRLMHVTGTNGKGSVIYYLEQGLGFAGNTGSWTGPHVFDYAERFHLNTQMVSHENIVKIYREMLLPFQEKFMQTHPGESLSFAELGILLSLHLFDQHEVKWGMMEVGAGGRYTPLMALDMDACILTNVGSDHPKTLGTELWQRALEKAGIARPGVPFFTSAEEPALTYVRKTAEAEGAPVYIVGGHDNQFSPRDDENNQKLLRGVQGGGFLEKSPPGRRRQNELEAIAAVIGEQPAYRLRNLALAVKVIRHFYPEFEFKPGTMSVELPARFWKVTPNIIADVSHNEDKIHRLAEQLRFNYPSQRFRFIIGLTRSRNVRRVFAPILELAEHIVITSASYAGQDPNELAEQLRKDFGAIEVIEEPKAAFEREKEKLKENQILVLTGSAYMIDQALNPNPYIRHLNATFGRRIITNNQS
ncbi:MAG: Mur ligase family protein [Candidatus Aminicenantes bacterium]|jgi:dihydrofolate synthase/folylpolyglutamate synthase